MSADPRQLFDGRTDIVTATRDSALSESKLKLSPIRRLLHDTRKSQFA
jgi:hypothetical protein